MTEGESWTAFGNKHHNEVRRRNGRCKPARTRADRILVLTEAEQGNLSGFVASSLKVRGHSRAESHRVRRSMRGDGCWTCRMRDTRSPLVAKTFWRYDVRWQASLWFVALGTAWIFVTLHPTMRFGSLQWTAYPTSPWFSVYLAIGTTILCTSLVVVLMRFIEWFSDFLGDRRKFCAFFGTNEVVAVVANIHAPPALNFRDPPMEARGHASKGTTKIVPFEELLAATAVAKIFDKRGIRFNIMLDSSFDSPVLPTRSIVALGLGFNRATHTLATHSNVFQIGFRGETDYFRLGDVAYADPDGNYDFAVVARVPVPVDDGLRPCFVCAGRTAEGTAAAGFFLKNHWNELHALYLAHRKAGDFSNLSLAAAIRYRVRGIESATIVAHQVVPWDWIRRREPPQVPATN